ncbi:hypothetical protein HZA96_01005 [Candidatus Woesearchaeota archaeon]|nr:hypothetical protein [Candidatus Woesearchaeota archaeon]
MNLKEIVRIVEQTQPFKDFKQQFPKAYLVHIFSMTKQPLQLGYYDENAELITTFDVNNGVQKEQSAPFREPNKQAIKPLEITQVSFSLEEAEEIAATIQKEKYLREMIRESIIILQHLDIGQIFNITFITHSFKTLNIKIDASTRQVISHDLTNLVGF